MKTAYFDCFAGISGDMTIGALLEVGVDFRALEAELKKLHLTGYRVGHSKVLRAGVAATKFNVQVSEKKEAFGQHSHPPGEGHAHSHESGHHSHRSLSVIEDMIETSGISVRAKALAKTIFKRLGAAEAKVHGIPVEQVHFHEVGAVDSIIDIVGSAICLDWLGLSKIVASPINVGSGFVQCDHGKFPVPGPATAELLKSAPVFSAGPEVEMTTPTGAAIISTVASEFRRVRDFKAAAIGYGAGSRDLKEMPNTLRVFVGEEQPAEKTVGEGSETVLVVEATIDDMNPQIYGYFMEKAIQAGALDVFVAPVQMKKNRPGHSLTVLCAPEDFDAISRLIFSETTTIGLRFHPVQRRVLIRDFETVETVFGKVRVKISRLNGAILTASPEYEDCQRLAQERSVPLKEVLAEANARIRSLHF